MDRASIPFVPVGDISRAAEILGIHRTTLIEQLERRHRLTLSG